jgi:hypothetical protein
MRSRAPRPKEIKMNPSPLNSMTRRAQVEDLRRRAETRALVAAGRRRFARDTGPDRAEHVLIRSAVPVDAPAVERLAQLDSRPRPAGDVLVAEVGGRLVAALPVNGGPAIADPFVPTADVVSLLQLRAAQLRDGGGPTVPHAHGVPGLARRVSSVALRTLAPAGTIARRVA